MVKLKLTAIVLFSLSVFFACGGQTNSQNFVIADSKSYETSIFRQNCAVCHGPEAEGRTLDDGRQVPSLRSAEHKFKTEDQIYGQISNGGNGMTPFRGQLSERELRLMATFVHRDLRNGKE